MVTELAHLGIVTSSLIVLVVIPFLPVSYVLFRGQQWPKIVLSAMVVGSGVQASVGLLWSHLAGKSPVYEVAALGAVWLLLSTWSIRRAGRHRNSVVCDLDREPFQPALILILCIGFAIRAIHPVEVAYLGQSDAYTHLNYIHNIKDFGYLINPVYPPGYHWIMALPALLFPIDPYLIARFGGVFFGTGLVLGIYVLLDQCVSRNAAIFGSFCAAAFPGMTLLMKTGVGAFANQFGLFLLPAILLFYIRLVTDRARNSNEGLLFLIALCGMAAAVPMMLIHVLLIIGLERLVMLVRYRRQWFGKTVQAALLIVPALCLFTYHMGQVGGGQRFGTAQMMTDFRESGRQPTTVEKVADQVMKQVETYIPEKKNVVALVSGSPYFKLALDYVSVKRKGFGNSRLDALGMVLAGLFLFLLLIGIVRREVPSIVVGLWGALTSVQAGTGLFQFSSYQREGWSLLVATCCLSGITAAFILQGLLQSRWFRGVVLGVMAVSVYWCATHPPFHVPIRSSAEDELVRTIRFLGAHYSAGRTPCPESTIDLCPLADSLSDESPAVLVTRRLVGWGNQGEIAPNVISPSTTLSVLTVKDSGNSDIFQPGRHYIVLIDGEEQVSGRQVTSAFAMVTPAMVRATLLSRNRLYRINSTILEQVEKLSDLQWDVKRVRVSDNLTAFVIAPLEPS